MDVQGAITAFGDLIGGSTNTTQTITTNTPVASTGLSTGAIVGISFGALAIIGIIITVIMSKKSAPATA